MFKKGNKVIEFFKKQGFYIALAACIAIVGVVSFLAVSEKDTAEEQQNGVDVRQSMDESISEIVKPSATARPTSKPSPIPTESPEPTKAPSQPKQRLAMPVDGEISRKFSGDVLVYNETLRTWMTHNGIDIAAKEGSEVKSALAGTVSRIYMDESKGQVIEVSHSSERTTRYIGLKNVNVKEGDKVNAGSALGILGIPAFEAADGAHLHFEYIVNGNYADPEAAMK